MSEVLDKVEADLNALEDRLDDALDGTVEVVERVKVSYKPHFILGGSVVAGLLVGGVVTYFVAKKRLEKKMYADFDAQVKAEVEKSKEFFARQKPATPKEALIQAHGQDAVDILESYQPTQEETELVERRTAQAAAPPPVVNNAFSNPVTDGWDQEMEEASRDASRPYIISADEAFGDDMGHEHVNLTYYEQDDVLSDESDMPLPNSDDVVGDDNLMRFGHGSKDKNLLYIRNEKLNTDYEIARDKGSFAQAIGLTEEPSEDQRRGRFPHNQE